MDTHGFGAMLVQRYIKNRFIQLLFILFGITFLSFLMMRIAGSDAVLQRMENTGILVSQEILNAERVRLGLDRPFFVQYFSWLKHVLMGDMGISYVTGKSVFSTFISKLPATLLLTAVTILFTIVISIPLGILTAVRKNQWVDKFVRLLSFIGNSLPNFFVALLLMYFLSIQLKIFPVISSGTSLNAVILPALTLTIAMASKYIRQVRSVVLDELDKAYVIGGKARGIKAHVTLMRSVLKSSMVTIITLLSLSIGSLLGGTAIVESIFMWDGVGKLAVDAIQMRDYPIIQAYVLWMALIYVFVNLITDLSYAVLDPRIRLEDVNS